MRPDIGKYHRLNMAGDDVDKDNPPLDRVYRRPRDQIVDFAFDATVAEVFQDMIRRSVPGYETVAAITGLIAARHLPAGGICYDLGCSLGAGAHAVLRAAGERDCRVVAIDSSAPMLARARALAAGEPRIEWRLGDVREAEVQNASVVLLNFVLQFLPPEHRLPLLRRLRAGLAPGGVVLVAEKLRAAPELEAIHLDFKRANAYSELEIAQKRTALENVMIPDAAADHVERLTAAGFAHVEQWFRCLNWGAFIARAEAP